MPVGGRSYRCLLRFATISSRQESPASQHKWLAIMSQVAQKGLVVVTGASGGIGYELCKLFARDGYPLLLVARSGDKLKAFAEELTAAHGVAVATSALDLAAPDAPSQLFESAQNQRLPVQVLVNNAGFGDYGPFAEADLAACLQMLQLNVVALTLSVASRQRVHSCEGTPLEAGPCFRVELHCLRTKRN